MTIEIFGARNNTDIGEDGLRAAETQFNAIVNRAARRGGDMSTQDLLGYQKAFNGYQMQVLLQTNVTKGMADTLKTIIRAIG